MNVKLKTVSITIDGEEFEVEREEFTARQLLALAALDPDVSYLILLKGEGKQVSYRDNLDEPIKVHEHMRFVSADLGAAPVA